MPTRPLPADANVENLGLRARALLDAHRERQPAALQRLREFHPLMRDETDESIAARVLSIDDAQLAIAHEYGFAAWSRLEDFAESGRSEELRAPRHALIADPLFRKAVDLLDAGDAESLKAHLGAHPNIARQRVGFDGWNYFQNPSLLEFVAENPRRNGCLPKTVADAARVILEAGAKHDQASLDDALALVASSSVARACAVQLELIDLLCDYGADPRAAHYPAALYGEFAAVQRLVERGLTVDLLVAAELNRLDDAQATAASADVLTLQKALAIAAQWGYTGVLRVILDAGADPNRYAPVGGHSHATPLHQAALGGHLDAVRLLVERGARTGIRDIHHDATPLEWARYGGRSDVAAYLEPITES